MTEKLKSILTAVILIATFTLVSLGLFSMYTSKNWYNLPLKNSQDWANFATYYTGIITPIITAVGLYYIINTFRLQQKQVNEMEKGKNISVILSSVQSMSNKIDDAIIHCLPIMGNIKDIRSFAESINDYFDKNKKHAIFYEHKMDQVFDLINHFMQIVLKLKTDETPIFIDMILQTKTKKLRDFANKFIEEYQVPTDQVPTDDEEPHQIQGLLLVIPDFPSSKMFYPLSSTLVEFLKLTKSTEQQEPIA